MAFQGCAEPQGVQKKMDPKQVGLLCTPVVLIQDFKDLNGLATATQFKSESKTSNDSFNRMLFE